MPAMSPFMIVKDEDDYIEKSESIDEKIIFSVLSDKYIILFFSIP